MKLWLDDVRPPPDPAWAWARTVHEAKCWLKYSHITECSLDHDLGYERVDIPEDPDWDEILTIVENATPNETGMDLVDWMVENEHVPGRITIHSWNPGGARAMAARLNRCGYDCFIEPFKSVKENTA